MRDAAEPSRLLGEFLEAPGGEHTDGNHGECEAEAERSDDTKTKREFLELQADDENRNCGGAGHESASQAENHNLSGRDLPIRETLLDFFRMRPGVRILVLMPVMMVMAMVPFAVMVMMSLLLAQAHDCPDGHADDDEAADEEEIGLGLLDVPVRAVLEGEAGEDPDDEGVGERSAEAEQGGLPGGPTHGDDEGRHHGLRMAGFEPVQRAEQDGDWDIKPGMGGALLQ